MKRAVFIILLVLSTVFAFSQELLVATYNTLRLGDGTKDYPTLATVIGHFDVLGAIEVMDESGMKKVKEYLPESWSYGISEKSVGTKKYKEYFGYFYNSNSVTVEPLGFYPNISNEFIRPPYGIKVTSKSGYTFNLVICHLIFGESSAARIREASNLGRVYTYFEGRTGNTATTIIAGDFNLESIKKFKSLTDLGLPEVSAMKKTTLGQVAASNDYDHMFVGKNVKSRIVESDVYYWTTDWNTRKTVSDHFPVYCIIRCK